MPATHAAAEQHAVHDDRELREADLEGEEVALLYRNAGLSQYVVLVAAPILSGALWHMASPMLVLGWLALVLTITALRIRLTAAYQRTSPAPADAGLWLRRFLLGVAASGAAWGAAGAVLMPAADMGAQFVVIFTLAGMVAAAVPTLAPVPLAFHLFCSLALLPLALRLFSGHDATHAALGVLTLLFMLGMAGIAQRLRTSLRRMLALQQENRALVATLTEANTRLATEVSERRRSEDNLRFVADHDGLTRLPNRSLFARCLGEALARARRNRTQLALLMIDLDRFKNINDALGHDAGDRLLGEVAQRLRGCLREADTLARLGGDEFVVLLENTSNLVAAGPIARRILEVLARPYTLDGRECHVTASIGITAYPGDGVDATELLKHADIAMYRAKDRGKNAFEFYSESLNRHSVERLALEASLRRALERGEFVLHYQPKVALATRRIVGLEALLRWRHPELGMVAPSAFVPLAEETGLIVPIGEWALHTACAQAQEWAAAGLSTARVAVNISARQFAHEDLPARIDGALAATRLEPDLLEIELTESMMMQEVERGLQAMSALKERGIRLAIDDFGTGYSSLGYLKRFPIDSVKIDRSFVRDLPRAREDCVLVEAAIAMAHALGLTIVAEGVETAAQSAFLLERGCDEAQGYYFAKPVPAAEATRLLAEPGAAHSAEGLRHAS